MADSPLQAIKDKLGEAIHAPKCYPCGYFQDTVEALAGTMAGRGELTDVLNEARAVFAAKEYDCLGCPVCYPAIAANAFAEMSPAAAAALDLCPTEEPDERTGWPLLPGDYQIVRYKAPVAVCTLNSSELATEIRNISPVGLSIVGTMHTVGIERVIRNVNANPNIRFLILCGQDTQQQVGHLPAQSLAALFANGLDERSRITGERGKRPVLKNLTAGEVGVFLQTHCQRQRRKFRHVGAQKEAVNESALAGSSSGSRIDSRPRKCPDRESTGTSHQGKRAMAFDRLTQLTLELANPDKSVDLLGQKPI
jgi:tetrahydromethanopterin S-methyltransferase subunit A